MVYMVGKIVCNFFGKTHFPFSLPQVNLQVIASNALPFTALVLGLLWLKRKVVGMYQESKKTKLQLQEDTNFLQQQLDKIEKCKTAVNGANYQKSLELLQGSNITQEEKLKITMGIEERIKTDTMISLQIGSLEQKVKGFQDANGIKKLLEEKNKTQIEEDVNNLIQNCKTNVIST